MKYAVPNPLQFAAVVSQAGVDRLAWVCGLAEGWTPFFWPGGVVGFTSGLVNLNTRERRPHTRLYGWVQPLPSRR